MINILFLMMFFLLLMMNSTLSLHSIRINNHNRYKINKVNNNNNNTFKRNISMLSDNEYEALNSIRSAARMGDVNKLQELCLQYKGNSELLSEKKGDFMGLSSYFYISIIILHLYFIIIQVINN